VRVDVSFDLLVVAWVCYCCSTSGSGRGLYHYRVCLLWLVKLKVGVKLF